MAKLKSTTLFFSLVLSQSIFGAPEKGFTDNLKQRLSDSGTQEIFDIVSTDPLNQIEPEFSIPKYFAPSTKFWFNIYTIYTSQQSVLHDKANLNLVYEVVPKNDPKGKSLDSRIKDYKAALESLGRSKNQCELCPQILKSISESKIKIPKNTKDKKLFFKERADSLRFQTGQRDMIAKGLHLSAPFFDKIYELIELYEIPSELLALAFLESSFNTNARSRAGATGVWQFMKVTGHHFMIVTPKNDHRLNPLLSTLAAFQLLKQSRKILGRWDLAVWSYNSGTPAVLNAQKKHGGSSMTLADMLQNYESERIRFASTNFYSSFLALVHALTYRYYLFPDELPDNNKIDAKNLKFYVSLCSFRPNWFFSLLEKTSPNIRDLNSHLRKRYRNTKYPRGTILISDRDLTKGRYYKLPKENYTNRYTKNWRLLIKGMKCNP